LPKSNVLLSPVGNRVTLFDLDNNSSRTLDVETRKDVQHIRPSADGRVLLLVDVEGHSITYDLEKDRTLNVFRFK
jgi:periodic tryptophan protein 2